MKKGAWANIPPKSNRSDPICFSPYLYRARNQVERFFNRIKQCRRVATRYDSLAGNYLAFVQLASIRLWLAARYEYTPFCNGPDDVKPPEYVTPPSSCFCPWSTVGRHIMLSEGAVSLSRYAWFVR